MAQHCQQGHRERRKERFLQEGTLDHFTDHQVLELLLFYAVPRADTNPIAHELIEQFGSFASVLEKPVEELEKIPGLGKSSAIFLKLILDSARRYCEEQVDPALILNTADKMVRFLKPKFVGRTKEVLCCVCMDNSCRVVSCDMMFEGTVNAASISTRAIDEAAIRHNSSNVLLAHNHPQGLALPSNEDIVTTQDIKKALAAVEVTLVDHIIVVRDDCVSLLESGYL